ncbi:alpha/beta fold hydrolase [Propionicicella superfundia]|uniref:alpha/beta fold hydrolase n=1 Tax=Propionicicella superfundia TaxID=348582 RepID=UPI0004117DFB|nr:alpha/beta hydrolase [Propionicicella superfundia]
MPELTVADGVSLYYEDSGGDGRPVVLIHGWSLSAAAWAANVGPLTAAGYRVVAYDRRGFGRSSKPSTGYDYDTLTADLASLMEQLDLTDAVLVGFSMGGGEVARYLGTQDVGRLAGVVFASSVTPALGITDTNPGGAMPIQGFTDMQDACRADREGFLEDFLVSFFSTPTGLKASPEQVAAAHEIAAQAALPALVETIGLWAQDFRADLANAGVAVLVIHGEGDQNVPFAASAARMGDIIPTSQLEVIPDGPHGINVTHAEAFTRALIGFADVL